MRHLLLVVVVVLVGWVTMPTRAVAGGYWRFFISVDGKPAFTGGIGVGGEFSPLDHLESSVQGGVQLGTDSFLDENTSGDITLNGDVVFRDQVHAPLHMKRLRLVYDRHEADRQSGTTVAGGYYDWRLHADDAALIVSHYRAQAGVDRAMRMAKRVAAVAVVVCVVTACLFIWRRRQRPSLHYETAEQKSA